MKIIIIIGLTLLLLLLAAAVFAGFWMCRFALDPKCDRSFAFGKPHNQFTPEEESAEKNRLVLREQWLKTVTRQEFFCKSEDGLNLHAYTYIPQGPAYSRWAVICHGYDGDAASMLDQARPLSQLGFNVLLPNARGHGLSEGSYIGMGWSERRDMIGWLDFILKRDPDAEVLLYGISMGAETVMMTVGEADLPGNVKAVIEDCGYTSVWDEFAYQLKAVFGLPAFPVLHLASLIARLRYGWSFGEASAVRQLAKSKVPILCIHGTRDTFVPVEMLEEVYAAASAPKERLVVEGAEHGGANVVGGERYWSTVRDFAFTYLTK